MWKLVTLYSFLSPFVFGNPLKVGLVLDKGGRDDKSFNSAAFKGATEAEKKFGISLKVVESSDDSTVEPNLLLFAQKGFDLIIGVGFVMEAPIKKIAKLFPKIQFLILDAKIDLPNVQSVTFKEHEGSFLVGVMGSLFSKTKKIGFIGGMEIPLIKRFQVAYVAGAKWANPKIEVLTNYVGTTSEAWKQPMQGKELSLKQFGAGADVIFTAAGASGLAVFDTAEIQKKYVIGVDSNQNWIKPGRVLTSMVKRIDKAVYDAVDQVFHKSFKGGVTLDLGLKEGGVDYSLDEFNRPLITVELEKKINQVKADIISGKIKVPDYYLQKNNP